MPSIFGTRSPLVHCAPAFVLRTWAAQVSEALAFAYTDYLSLYFGPGILPESPSTCLVTFISNSGKDGEGEIPARVLQQVIN